MNEYLWAHLTYAEAEAMLAKQPVAILPLGSIEPHGPHLPLNTDIIIAEGMACRAAELLNKKNIPAYVLPTVPFTVTDYAQGFAGAVSLSLDTMKAQYENVFRSLLSMGFKCVAIANAHLEPEHLNAIHYAQEKIGDAILFPDITRKPWALLLTDEFKKGECHAGQFETSLVMADRPDLVNEHVRQKLEDIPISLSKAIREGKKSFEAMGSESAYFGSPRNATAEEGQKTFAILAGMIVDEVVKKYSAQQ
jgi:creatinine amidohydrolase